MRKLIVLFALAFPLFAAKPEAPPAELNAPPAEAQKLENGLIVQKLVAGSGTAKPAAEDIARLRYTIWRSNGTLVQHVEAPQFVEVPVTKMVRGLSLAVQEMVEGERIRVWIPAPLSGGKLEGDEKLMVETELVSIVPMPSTPPDVAARPSDATVTSSGLAYKILRAGTGKSHPKRTSEVTVHYSGWTTDGTMFDSSIMRGRTATFGLGQVIRGWTEGLQLMVAGEKTRFWIPSKLAYGNDRTKPQGMLVFDVELISFK